MVYMFGQMGHNSKETGIMIKQWEKEPYIIPKEIFLQANSQTIQLQAMVNMFIFHKIRVQDGQNTVVNSKMVTYQMGMFKRNGKMELNMLVSINLITGMAMENILGHLEVFIKEIGKMEK